MNLIILDFEWNQPYDSKHALKQPIYLHGEIVQIGAVKFDENHHILDTFKILVTPKYYPKMLKKISKLTGIKNSDLQYGFPFPVAFKHFKNWCGPDFAFLTWGPDDIGILRENMLLHRLDTGWIPKAYDLQVIFDDQIAGKNRQTSLTDAVQMVGENALEAHDALNDARNTARVCLHLDINRGLSEYKERGWSGDHQVPLGSGIQKHTALMQKPWRTQSLPIFTARSAGALLYAESLSARTQTNSYAAAPVKTGMNCSSG